MGVASFLTGRCFRSTPNRSSDGTYSMAQWCEAEAPLGGLVPLGSIGRVAKA